MNAATTDKQPCSGCGYMIRGGSMCGDCREYGPPRGWRWEYDPATGKHTQLWSGPSSHGTATPACGGGPGGGVSVAADRANAETTDRCWINNGGFALDGKTHMTGAQIRALPLPSIRDTDDLYMEVPGSEDVLVAYDEVVPVIGRRFFSVPSIINAGAPASDAATGDVPADDDGMEEIEVGPLTYDRLRVIAKRLNCTVSAALEEVLREFKV